MPNTERKQPSLHGRLLWFVALWAGGVLTVAAIGAVVRALGYIANALSRRDAKLRPDGGSLSDRRSDQRGGIAYIRPPCVQRAFIPRGKFSFEPAPRLRSKLSP